MAGLQGFWPASLNWLDPYFEAGQNGVEIFFVISGFLITASLIRHDDPGRFLLDRAIRIYPVFLTIHLIVFGFGPIIGYKWMAGLSAGDWFVNFVSNLLFLPGLFDLPLAQLNAWSLSYEAAFYLASAGLFLLSRRAGRGPMFVAMALLGGATLYRYPRGAFFLVGAGTYFMFVLLGRRPARWLRPFSVPALFAVFGLLAWGRAQGHLHLSTLLAMPMAFIFFWSIVDGRCAAARLLRAGWLQYLGTISYSFYLWSPVVTYPLKVEVARLMNGQSQGFAPVVLFALASGVTALAVSHVSQIWLEARAGRALHAWAAGRRAA